MAGLGVHLFETALGRAGIVWGEAGIVALAFPQADAAKTRAHLIRRAPGAAEAPPPEYVRRLIDNVAALLRGERVRFDDAPLDFGAVPQFDKEVYRLTRAIPPGETKTYGDLAKALGDVGLSRRVGQALGRNPFPIVVPCHRVIGVGGFMTGFSAPGGAESKRKLLKIEGALAPELFDRR